MFDGSSPALGVLLGLVFLGMASYVIWRARRNVTTVESGDWLGDPLRKGAAVGVTAATRGSVAPTEGELAKIEEMRGKGLSLEDACRLARSGYSWLGERDKAAYQAAVQHQLGLS